MKEKVKQSVSPSPPQADGALADGHHGVLLDKDATAVAHIFNSAIHPRRKASEALWPIPVNSYFALLLIALAGAGAALLIVRATTIDTSAYSYGANTAGTNYTNLEKSLLK